MAINKLASAAWSTTIRRCRPRPVLVSSRPTLAQFAANVRAEMLTCTLTPGTCVGGVKHMSEPCQRPLNICLRSTDKLHTRLAYCSPVVPRAKLFYVGCDPMTSTPHLNDPGTHYLAGLEQEKNRVGRM